MLAYSFYLDSVEAKFVPLIYIIICGICGLVFILLLALFRGPFYYSRRLKKHSITAKYQPPLGFSPIEIGYLFHGRLQDREIGALIINMIKQGYLTIKMVDSSKRIFAGPRIGNNLKNYEKVLLKKVNVDEGAILSSLLSIFKQNGSNKLWKNITKQQGISFLIHRDLIRRQYVHDSVLKKFLLSTFRIMLLLVILVFTLPYLILWTITNFDSGTIKIAELLNIIWSTIIFSLVFFIPLFLVAIILNYCRGRITGREWIITPKLKRLWPQIVGYRQYVKLVENERLHFHDENLQKASKNDVLPYAVAFGFVKNWRNILS